MLALIFNRPLGGAPVKRGHGSNVGGWYHHLLGEMSAMDQIDKRQRMINAVAREELLVARMMRTNHEFDMALEQSRQQSMWAVLVAEL